MTSLSRNERLDNLPFNTQHRRLLVGSGLGWALDAMDVGLISFVMAALAKDWSLAKDQVGLIASIGMAGMAVGATFGGLIADKMGRKQVFALSLLIFGLATGASALSTSLAMLLVFRFIVGLGLGAELPVASTLVSEFAPASIRGRVIVLLEAFWAVGWILAALIGYFVVPAENGWRWALAIGAVPALYALYVRRSIPESVRFLEETGRHEEAEVSVQQFESGRPLAGSLSRAAAPAVEQEHVEGAKGVSALFGPVFIKRTIGLWGVWFFLNFAYYGAFIWLPSLLVSDGISLTKSFGYTLIITLAQLPGYAVAAWLIEAWGRRATLAAFLAGAGVGAVLFSQASTPTTIVLAGCLLSFFALGAWGAVYAVTPEVYPTAIRATGAGWAAGFGRLASIAAPMTVPLLLEHVSTGVVFAVFAGAFALATLSALLLPETKGRALA
ncbi:MAG: MFS transporter [Buchananella hordeovulneris]|nr:MFS transporter [Buchananella hordeovulneris]